jgi:hypothetical protein
MATKKTSMFTLTERITLTNTNETFATMDIGSYVDVGDRQALQVHSVDFIFQGNTPAEDIVASVGAGQELKIQVTDLNRGGLVFANDRALVASGNLMIDTSQGVHQDSDLYPDNYGKGSDDGRYVVNDQLYVTARATGVLTAANITVRVNASIVSLTAKDFMAIAIQSTAADN